MEESGEKLEYGYCPFCWQNYAKKVKMEIKRHPPVRECPDCGTVINES